MPSSLGRGVGTPNADTRRPALSRAALSFFFAPTEKPIATVCVYRRRLLFTPVPIELDTVGQIDNTAQVSLPTQSIEL